MPSSADLSLSPVVIKDITNQLPFKSSLGTRKLSDVKGVVVHHTAAKQDARPAIERIKADANYHISKGWGHLSYHYMIDTAGNVYLCVKETEIGAHAGDWQMNKTSIAVCIDGDCTVERLNSLQVQALWSLLDYLCTNRPDLPGVLAPTVRTHREVRPTPTACPSDRVQKIVDSYRV